MSEKSPLLPIDNNPISKTKVRKGVYAYRYHTGLIAIGSFALGFESFYYYPMQEAIRLWRSRN